MSIRPLPDGFEALEPFAETWAIDGSAGRMAGRLNSETDERQAFYDAAVPLLTPALALLDQTPLSELDDDEKRLLDVMLSLAHVSIAVEVQGPQEKRQSVARRRMVVQTTVADQPPLR